MPDKMINIGHADNVVINTVAESSASCESSKDILQGLIEKAYSCTVLFRKTLNNLDHSEESEMQAINDLHSAITNIYYFFEGNKDHPKADTARSLVDTYNCFLGQFKNFVELRNAGIEWQTEADRTSACFAVLVDALLAARKE